MALVKNKNVPTARNDNSLFTYLATCIGDKRISGDSFWFLIIQFLRICSLFLRELGTVTLQVTAAAISFIISRIETLFELLRVLSQLEANTYVKIQTTVNMLTY